MSGFKYSVTQMVSIFESVEQLSLVVSTMLDDSTPWTDLQCREVEAIAAVMEAAGWPAIAAKIIDLHAEGDDDPDDEHHDAYIDHQTAHL